MGEVIELVRGSKEELIAAIQALLRKAEASPPGALVGLALVAMYDDHYEVDLAGETKLHPTYTRGAVLDLLDELGQLIHGESSPR